MNDWLNERRRADEEFLRRRETPVSEGSPESHVNLDELLPPVDVQPFYNTPVKEQNVETSGGTNVVEEPTRYSIGTCKECKFFNSGMCMNKNSPTCSAETRTYYDDDFGCIHWEEK